MKSTVTLFLILLISFSGTFAQNDLGVVRGNVKDADGEALPFATVMLMSAQDSSLAKAGYTNESGDFALTPVDAGEYFLKVTYTSMAPYASEIFPVSEGQKYEAPGIVLQTSDAELDAVKITAQKPLITIKPDMTVFNVQASTNAIGSDGLELLRKAPGVMVDNNDNIILQGKSGVRIYIDGKPSPLTTADLAAMLKTMQSSQIEAIEIITNPGAKYDAEGNAGIINIRLVKDKSLGTNGNLDLGYGIGRYSKYNGSISANHRNKKVNVFGSLGGNTGRWFNFMNFYRIQNETVFDQESETIRDGYNVNAKVGADFFVSEKSTIGVLANGFNWDGAWNNTATTDIRDEATMEPISTLQALSSNDVKRQNLNANLNYRYDDKKGQTWNIDADYGFFNLSSDAYQPNYYYNPDGSLLSESIFSTNAPTSIDIATLKFDHERNIGKGKFGFGAKSSYVMTDNDFQFYDRVNEADTLNLDRSNRFEYTENINAAYVNYKRQMGKWGISVGLRGEQTNSLGELTSAQVTGNDTVKRNYFNLFPSGGLTYQQSQNHMFRMNYSRRIDRPRYQDLNPFSNRLDELTYQQGNPFLRPQYTNALELTHVYKYRYSTSLKYSYTVDMMTQITDTTEETRSFITNENLASQEVISLYVSAPASITKWWSTFTNAGVFRTRNQANYGVGKEIDLAQVSFNIYHQSTFKLPKDFSFEVSGFYNSPGIWGANFNNREFWGVDVGARKKILDGKGNVKVALSDVFYSMQWRGIQEYGGLYMDASGGWESRQLKFSFSYLFGNDQVKASRRRKTGLEDESGRAGGGGGGGIGR